MHLTGRKAKQPQTVIAKRKRNCNHSHVLKEKRLARYRRSSKHASEKLANRHGHHRPNGRITRKNINNPSVAKRAGDSDSWLTVGGN